MSVIKMGTEARDHGTKEMRKSRLYMWLRAERLCVY